MPITGSQPALMTARLGVMRLGASRLGAIAPIVIVTINGVNRTALRHVRVEGISVRDYLDGTPNTATLRISGFTPTVGHEVKIGLGDLAVSRLVFAGHILRFTQVAEGSNSAHIVWDLECISYEWLLNRRKVTAKFTATSASTIVTSVMTNFTSGFTASKVEAGLETLDEITFTNEDVMTALDRVARRIGAHWVVDYGKDLYFGITSDGAAQPITTATPHSMGLPSVPTDLSQIRTRVSVEGMGSPALSAVDVGMPVIPVADATPFAASGGAAAAAQNKITYTGKDLGGTGAIIGTGVAAPSNALTSTAAIGSGLSAGYYKWKASYGTAAGETLAGPESASVLLGTATANPTTAPAASKQFPAGNLSLGAYQYKVAFVTAAGETLAGPASSAVTITTADDIAAPTTIGVAANWEGVHGGALDPDAQYSYKYTFYDSTSGAETLPGPASNSFYALNNGDGTAEAKLSRTGDQAPPSGFARRYYRTDGGGATYKLMPGAGGGFSSNDGDYSYDTYADTALGAAAPTVSTATKRRLQLSSIPVSSDPNVTARKIYRTAANGSTFKLLTTISDNTTTTYADNVADASLGATEPASNTSILSQAALSNIPTSPDPAVTSRKLYRTVANGGTFKLLATIANNTTTTYTDSTADASLGANEPSSNTSGLSAAEGTVNAGSSTIPVSSTGDPPFHASGGWVRILSQVVRYTGKTSTTLTGVPAAGSIGALTATVKYGTEIMAAPMLTGVPTSGPGSIAYAIVSGEPVNLVVTRNDTAAQAVLAAYLGSSDPNDGILEEYLQDNRLSLTEAGNRADAKLAEVKDALVTVLYPTRDPLTRTGREVTITLDAPWNVTGTFKIQSVTISQFDPRGRVFPLRVVEASSRRFRLEDYLRLLKAA